MINGGLSWLIKVCFKNKDSYFLKSKFEDKLDIYIVGKCKYYRSKIGIGMVEISNCLRRWEKI